MFLFRAISHTLSYTSSERRKEKKRNMNEQDYKEHYFKEQQKDEVLFVFILL